MYRFWTGDLYLVDGIPVVLECAVPSENTRCPFTMFFFPTPHHVPKPMGLFMALTRLAFEVHDLCNCTTTEPRIEMPRETIAISVHIACSLWSLLPIYHTPRAHTVTRLPLAIKKKIFSLLRFENASSRFNLATHPTVDDLVPFFPFYFKSRMRCKIGSAGYRTLQCFVWYIKYPFL